jgi:peptidoglycan/LPS O-acetylase OafA/YrhL
MRHTADNFDGLRLIGALLVLISHQFALSGRPEPLVTPSSTFGALGVLIFFSISGYLVARSWMGDPDPRRFAMRRLLRIWPGLAAAVLVTALGALLVTGTLARPLYLLNLLLVYVDGPFFPNNRYHLMNGSLWTIQLEVICYVLLAGVGLLAARRTRTLLLVLGCIAGPAYVFAMGPAIESGQIAAGIRLLPYFSAFFFAGSAQAVRQPGLPTVAAVCLLGVVAFVLGRPTLGLLLTVPVLAILVGTRSWPVLREGGRFGDLSYGAYLWAWPIQQVGVVLLPKQTPLVVLLAVTLVCVLAAAWLSWHFVEKGPLRHKPRRAASPRASVSSQASPG